MKFVIRHQTSSLSLTPAVRRDLDTAYPLAPDQIQRFQEQGFIKLKEVLLPETIAFYGAEITRQVFRLNTMDKPMEERTTYERAFLQVMNIWTKSEIVKEFAFSRKLARIAAELMGVAGVRMYHDQALYKEPSGGITPWHADQYYWPVSTDNTCTVWVPLQPTPMEMGPLAFSVGSHRYQMGRDLEIGDSSEAKINRELLEKGLPLEQSAFNLGDVSYHYGWNFHRAGGNTTSEPRRVITINYIEDGCRLLDPKNKNQLNDWTTWMPGASVGDIVDSPLNPVL
jgi:ectoine hydroxylase-related dioxygenase (phytanoyl-CoA dioxygenase family)